MLHPEIFEESFELHSNKWQPIVTPHPAQQSVCKKSVRQTFDVLSIGVADTYHFSQISMTTERVSPFGSGPQRSIQISSQGPSLIGVTLSVLALGDHPLVDMNNKL